MSKEQLIKDLSAYIGADFPLIYLYTVEEQKTVNLLNTVAETLEISHVYTYDISSGFECTYGKDKRIKKDKRAKNLYDALEFVSNNIDEKSIVVFKEISQFLLNDPILAREFKNVITKQGRVYSVFIVSSVLSIPPEIEKDVTVKDIELPDRDEIKCILSSFLDENSISMLGIVEEKFIEALTGLTENEIDNTLAYCIQDNGTIDEDDIEKVMLQKKQQIRKSNVIEYYSDSSSISDVGGLERLKSWLKSKKYIYEKLQKARETGVDIPKGVLLFGMPGCGKSLISKAIAKNFEMPLLRLDMGMILGPYLGQSEENIRKAIKITEAISPAVLWIDELEKALSGSGGGGGSDVSTRILGTLLTWMQEKTKPVFVIATANDISGIPPEFMRKGRFDEIFFVDFPKNQEIKEILKIHLKKRKKEIENIDFDKIINSIKGKEYSGADIEAVVKEVIEDAFVRDKFEISTDEIDAKMKNIKTLFETMGEKVKELRAAKDKFKAELAS